MRKDTDKKTIVLGVTGSIAAYKAAEITSRLVKSNYDVHVIITEAAAKLIAPLTFQTLTKNKVYVDMFEEIVYNDVRHISLAQRASCFVIAPATANIIGKIASGIADDMLSTVVMAVPVKKTPIIICPAMNTAMYENPITQSNIAKLRGHGYSFVEPKESMLACGDIGKGALADIGDIITAIEGKLCC
jgi:phosphopantothenoylcysteine decarboxylase/phosphopantothenoylcysteine decarboxylase/phosphopantothenate--cysteine ligase